MRDEFVLWTLESDLVSMAAVGCAAAGVSRIGPVYNPTDRPRERAASTAVTAAAAASGPQEAPTKVVLFIDLANPVSNVIYQRIGFQAGQRFGTHQFQRAQVAPHGNAPHQMP